MRPRKALASPRTMRASFCALPPGVSPKLLYRQPPSQIESMLRKGQLTNAINFASLARRNAQEKEQDED